MCGGHKHSVYSIGFPNKNAPEYLGKGIVERAQKVEQKEMETGNGYAYSLENGDGTYSQLH